MHMGAAEEFETVSNKGCFFTPALIGVYRAIHKNYPYNMTAIEAVRSTVEMLDSSAVSYELAKNYLKEVGAINLPETVARMFCQMARNIFPDKSFNSPEEVCNYIAYSE